MRELQQRIIAQQGVLPEIDPAAEVERRVAFLADYLAATGASGFVLGISGGVDIDVARIEVLREHAEIPDGEGAIGHEVDEG